MRGISITWFFILTMTLTSRNPGPGGKTARKPSWFSTSPARRTEDEAMVRNVLGPSSPRTRLASEDASTGSNFSGNATYQDLATCIVNARRNDDGWEHLWRTELIWKLYGSTKSKTFWRSCSGAQTAFSRARRKSTLLAMCYRTWQRL